MKKFLNIAVAALAVLSGCSDDNIVADQNGNVVVSNANAPVFKAELEGEGATRTQLAAGSATGKKKVEWLSTDKVFLYSYKYAANRDDMKSSVLGEYEVTPSAENAANATLTPSESLLLNNPEVSADSVSAIYPASFAWLTTTPPEYFTTWGFPAYGIAEDMRAIILPATQTYNGTDISTIVPMFAYSSSSSEPLVFKNLTALLAITVKSSDFSSVQSIVVTSDKPMNDCYKIETDSENEYSLRFDISEVRDKNRVVTLDCKDSKGDNTVIPEGGSTTFYVSIPPQTYKYLNIDVTDGTTTKYMRSKKLDDIVVKRNKIYPVTFAQNLPLPDANLIASVFSVNSVGKQVKFAKGNLYWDGSDFKFEENQTDSPTEWKENHVGHFSWTNWTDYNSGTAKYMPYALWYDHGNRSTDDEFWCGQLHPITVEGTSGMFALSKDEWNYLIKKRAKANDLCKYGVKVTDANETDHKNCLILAPDGFTGTLKSEYTLAEINTLGLVCLPASGARIGDGEVFDVNKEGIIWASTPTEPSYTDPSNYAYILTYNAEKAITENNSRNVGNALRLVRHVETRDYVDLGLKSGTLWATCNIGADKPEECGLYFAWGETAGYSGDTSDGRKFDWASYKWCDGSRASITKYCNHSEFGTVDNKSELDPTDDAATVNWGSEWQMPSKEQLDELISSVYTTKKWTTLNGVDGVLITSKKNGNTLFFPRNGIRKDGEVSSKASGGWYWSSTIDPDDDSEAYYLNFDSNHTFFQISYYRMLGCAVRPVRVKK